MVSLSFDDCFMATRPPTLIQALYLEAGPALVQRDEDLPQHLAGGGGGHAGGVQHGGASSLRSAAMMLALATVRMASSSCKTSRRRLQGFGAGEAGGVEAVEVNGEVDRHLALTESFRQLGKAGEIELVHLGVLGRKLPLGPVAAPDAELMDAAVPTSSWQRRRTQAWLSLAPR